MKKIEQTHRRKQYYIDRDVQTGLMLRLVTYWGASILFLTLPIALINVAIEPQTTLTVHLTDVFKMHWPILLMTLVLLPFAINDTIKFSNRFAGPIFRLRSELQRFVGGGRLRSFRFRQDDFWQDVAVSMDKVSSRLNELEDQQNEQLQDATTIEV